MTGPEREELNRLETEALREHLTPWERDEIERLCSGVPSLVDYVKAAWHVVEPGTTYLHNWHIDAIFEHLEYLTAGEILKLIIAKEMKTQSGGSG